MNAWTRLALTAAAVTVLGACRPEGSASPSPSASASASVHHAAAARAGVPSSAAPKPAAARTAKSPLLMPAPGGDGDSWHDTLGREYRLGLVNTPEYDECFGSQATAKRKALTARGFRADVYTHDTYGRSVAVVTTADGLNLNVYLARYGYANDKYLAEFRHENPALAAQLDRAFAAARAEHRGLWAACAGTQSTAGTPTAQAAAAPPPATQANSSCHPDYVTCIPIKGDGSGHTAANDLDCGDIRQRVQLRHIGVDPYRLDADGNGVGCDSY